MLGVTLVLAGSVSTLAQQDQSPAQLRLENDQLRERIEDLERQLGAAQRRIAALESTNQRLQERLERGGSRPQNDTGESGETEEPEREMAPVPEDPFAAPAAMREMLAREYVRTTEGMSYDSAGDRNEYLRTIRRWANQSKRDINGPVSWTVRVLESSGGRGKVGFTIEVVQNAGELPIGEAFEIEVVGRNVQKLEDAVGGDPIQIDGVFSGSIEIDESLGASGDPMFLGPFARLDYRVAIRSVR
jgi:predicted RNase H-like nuclease (RuvC/YqgF family)